MLGPHTLHGALSMHIIILYSCTIISSIIYTHGAELSIAGGAWETDGRQYSDLLSGNFQRTIILEIYQFYSKEPSLDRDTHTRTQRRNKLHDSSRFVLVFVAIALAVIWTTAIIAGVSQRITTISRAEDELLRLNQLVAEQTGNLFTEIRAYLMMLDTWLVDNPDADPRTNKSFIDLVHIIRTNVRIPIDIRLVSEKGQLYYITPENGDTPRANVSDREYFTAQLNSETQGFYIARPVLSRVTGRWGIPVSYPVTGGNAGISVIFAAIELPTLNELYESVRPKPGGAITLAKDGGILLDRVPFDPAIMGTALGPSLSPGETYEGIRRFVSPADREERIVAFNSIPGMPLVISVSVPRSDVLMEWTQRVRVWLLVLAGVSVMFAALGMFLWRSWKENVKNEHGLSRLNDELIRANEMARLVTENSSDVFTVVSLPELIIEYVSPSVERNWGWMRDEFIGQPLENILNSEMADRIQEKIVGMMRQIQSGDSGGRHGKIDIDIPHKEGFNIPYDVSMTIICDDRGEPMKAVALARDLSDRKANEEIVRNMAFYDRLTGLANRRLLDDRLGQLLRLALRDGSKFAVLFVDLDRFKPVNDTYGHEAGDWLLRQVADRMRSCVRGTDTVARTGGDEFVVTIPDIRSVEEAAAVGEKIRASLEEPYIFNKTITFEISASIGVVLYPDHGKDARNLLLMSDAAMYQAKKAGRNRVVVYPAETGDTTDTQILSVTVHWQDSYCSGQQDIDRDHRELFQLANGLPGLIAKRNREGQSFGNALTTLRDHVEKHFSDEEKILREHNYTDVQLHSLLHRELLRAFDDLVTRFDEGTASLEELVEYITRTVIEEHLLMEDRKFFYLFDSSAHASLEQG